MKQRIGFLFGVVVIASCPAANVKAQPTVRAQQTKRTAGAAAAPAKATTRHNDRLRRMRMEQEARARAHVSARKKRDAERGIAGTVFPGEDISEDLTKFRFDDKHRDAGLLQEPSYYPGFFMYEATANVRGTEPPTEVNAWGCSGTPHILGICISVALVPLWMVATPMVLGCTTLLLCKDLLLYELDYDYAQFAQTTCLFPVYAYLKVEEVRREFLVNRAIADLADQAGAAQRSATSNARGKGTQMKMGMRF